jgi:trk system potassium uptake protein TrkH
MNYRGVLVLLGRLQLVLAITLLIPAAVDYLGEGGHVTAFLLPFGAVGIVGILSEVLFRQRKDFVFGRREGFLLVTAAWTMASVVGALPSVLINGPAFAADALFESASGFTTTGATILVDIEAQPASLLLWRSLSQWLGGMGIIVLGIAILPKLAVGGMQLLGAEAPGPLTEKLTPRIAQTAKTLWGIYLLLTALEFGALRLAGMGSFDAVNHAMTTIATAGFSTLQGSIGGFHSTAIELVVMFFMIVSGINFALHFRLLLGDPRPVLRDTELRVYLFLIVAATVLLTGDLMIQGHEDGVANALRLGAFQATTIISTTGYTTADYDAWPAFARTLLFTLMFIGGCAGSTGGSVKVMRILIAFKKMAVEIKRLGQPRAVLPVRVGRRAIPDDVVTSVTTFLLLFLTLFAAGGVVMGAFGLDPVSAFGASAACLGNIGPGFGLVGPAETFAVVPAPAKLILVGMMIVGRLELYTVLVSLYLVRRSA